MVIEKDILKLYLETLMIDNNYQIDSLRNINVSEGYIHFSIIGKPNNSKENELVLNNTLKFESYLIFKHKIEKYISNKYKNNKKKEDDE